MIFVVDESSDIRLCFPPPPDPSQITNMDSELAHFIAV